MTLENRSGELTATSVFVRPTDPPVKSQLASFVRYTTQPLQIGFDYKITGSATIQTTSVVDDLSSKVSVDQAKREITVLSAADWKLTSTNKGSFGGSLGMMGSKGTKSINLSASSDIELATTQSINTKYLNYTLQSVEQRISSEIRNKHEQIEKRTIELVADSGYLRTVLEIHNPTEKTIKIQSIDIVFTQHNPETLTNVPLMNVVIGASSQLNGTIPGRATVDNLRDDHIEVPPTLRDAPFIRTISIEKLPNQLVLDWLNRAQPLSVRINATKFENENGQMVLAEETLVPFLRRNVQISIVNESGLESNFFQPNEKCMLGEYIALLNDASSEYTEVQKAENGQGHIVVGFRGYTTDLEFAAMEIRELYDHPNKWSSTTGAWILESSCEVPPDAIYSYIPKSGDRFRMSWVTGADIVKVCPPEFNYGGLIATLPASSNPQSPTEGFPFKWFGGEIEPISHGEIFTIEDQRGLPFKPMSVIVSNESAVRIRFSGYRSHYEVKEKKTNLDFHGPIGTATERFVDHMSVSPINNPDQVKIGLIFTRKNGQSQEFLIADLIPSGVAQITQVGLLEFEVLFRTGDLLQRQDSEQLVMSISIRPPTFTSSLGKRVDLIPRPNLAGAPAGPNVETFPWVDGEEIQESQFVNLWINVRYRPIFNEASNSAPSQLDPDSFLISKVVESADYRQQISDVIYGWPISRSTYSLGFPQQIRCQLN